MAFSREQLKLAILYVLDSKGFSLRHKVLSIPYESFRQVGITIGGSDSVPTEAEKMALVDLLRPIVLHQEKKRGRKHMRSDARHVTADSRGRVR